MNTLRNWRRVGTARGFHSTAIFVLLPIFFLATAMAQSPQGTIVGTALDPTGATVANVRVTVTNQATQVSREFTTNSAGDYNAPFLPVGVYSVSATASGFKKLTVSDVRLDTGRTVRIDVSLEVGDVANSVTVEGGGVPLVQTEKPTLATSLTTRELKELPSGMRYFMNYLVLAPGNAGSMATVFNGGQRLSVNFVMDGVNIKDLVRGEYTAEMGAGPSVEALSEVNVKTSTASTDTGLGTAEIHLISKSGSNQFHGSLFEYYRGNIAEARNLFNATSKIPRTVRNQYGGSLGGPIIKNKTFFFANVEDFESRGGSTSRFTVPTVAMRGGDFSEYPGLVLKDTTTSTTVANQLPFAGNIIPKSRITTTSQAILNYYNYPTPNLSGLSSNYITSLVPPRRLTQYTAKIDHILSAKDTLSGRLWQGSNSVLNYQGYDTKNVVAHLTYLDTNVQATWTRIITPTMTNEARFGFYNMPRDITPTDPGENLFTKFGIQGLNIVDETLQKYGPRFNFGGTGSIQFMGENPVFPQVLETRTYALNDTFSLVRPRHSLRAGFQFLFVQTPFFSTGNTRGTIQYTGNTAAWWSTSHAFADFLLDNVYNASTAGPHPVRNLRENNYGFFLTDDWKVAKNLTLSLGLRYEVITPMTEANDVGLSSLDLASRSILINAPSLPSGMATRIGYNNGLPVVTSQSMGLGRSLQKGDYNNIAPRIGFAYRPFGGNKTVFRGGYGIYYADECILFLARQTFNAPWTYNNSYSSSNQKLSTTTPFLSGALSAPGFTSFDKNIPTAYTQQWNFTIERALAEDLVWQVSYVGSKGTNLWQSLNVGQATDVKKVGATLVYTYPIPELSSATTWFGMANATYNALQTEVRKRWAKGFQLTGNWTWAKHIDTDCDSGNPMDSRNLNRDRSNGLYSHRHNVAVYGMWELPVGHGKRFLSHANPVVDGVLGGWRLSGVQRWYTGRYVSVTANVGSRADRVLGVGMFDNVPAGRWFNTAAFSVPYYNADDPKIVFGNSARNILPTPNQFQFDASLVKSFRIREGHELSIRVEGFNIPNHPNLGIPSSTNIQDTANVGRITSASQARYFQWSARYDF